MGCILGVYGVDAWVARVHRVDIQTLRVDGQGAVGTQGHAGCFMAGTQTPKVYGKDTGTRRACKAWTQRVQGAERRMDGQTPSTDSVAKSLAVRRFLLTATIIQRWQKR